MSLSTTKTRDYPRVDRMRGVNYLKFIDVLTYTLANEDKGKVLIFSQNATIEIPSLSIPVGSQIDLIAADGTGAYCTPAADVTLNSKGGQQGLAGGYSGATLIKTGPSEWTLIGDLA